MNIKNEVLVRAYVVLGLTVLVALLIYAKAVQIVLVDGDKWRARSDSLYVKLLPVDAERGNILADDGSLIATSLPFFELRMDMMSDAMREEDFNANIDSLSWCLSKYVNPKYTPEQMKMRLLSEKQKGNRYVLIKKKASYDELEKIKRFPLFRLGRYRGGLIVLRRSERKRPYSMLAHRTIGYVRDGAKPVGLEGRFNKELGGKAGKQSMLRVGNKTWIPLNDLKEVEPQDGLDLKTTLNVNIQDITQKALLRAMKFHDADKGSAVVMEVETGAIKAIANLGKTKDGYWERYNYAIGAATEPGSTFKLASIMALLEDGYISLDDSIDLEGGKTTFYEEEMVDAAFHGIDSTSIRHAFEISSNVGIAKLVNKYYGKKGRAKKFIDRIKKFNIDQVVGIEIDGEPAPYIKEAYNKEKDNWSGITLPWMSTGYELTITPLQILSFYNAVANDGVLMKPYLVDELQKYGETVKQYHPTIIKNKIASRKTISLVQDLLEGVVENGTAKRLKTEQYRFAGKTGTAQINYQKLRERTNVGGHQASFVGYFPANKPKYSCIVTISNPKEHGFYGSQVAGPVFREISDNCFKADKSLHEVVNESPKIAINESRMPQMSVGMVSEMKAVADFVNLPFEDEAGKGLTVLQMEGDVLKMSPKKIQKGHVPNVKGMGLRDAMFILENMGMKVKVEGFGKVTYQSVRPGTQIRREARRTIKLKLS